MLVTEIVIAFLLVILTGFQVIKLEQWLVALVFNVIIAQTFGLVYIVVKNAFPSEDKILDQLGNMRDGNLRE